VPDPIPGPDVLVQHFRSFLANQRVAYENRARFGPFTIAAKFHGWSPDGSIVRALRAAAGTPDFTIHVIDGQACALPRPRLAWTRDDFGPKRVVPGWSTADRTVYLLRAECGVAVADWHTRQAFIWLPSAGALPWFERAAPFRWLFDGLAPRLGMAMMHAAAIGIGGDGALLVGRGGVGKSTLALACLGDGFDYAGDDYCLLSGDATQYAHAVYSTAKWKKDATVVPGWLNGLAPDAVDTTEQKNIVFVEAVKPQSLVDSLLIRAIIVPCIHAGSSTFLEPMSPQAALPHVANSTVAQSEAEPGPLVRALAALVRNVPAYRLRMTRDPDLSVLAVRQLLAQSTSRKGFAG
jgi:hypothetical protein